VGRKSAAKTYEDGISGKQWASPASFSLNEVALRWGLPTSSIGDEALGSGLAFALHPDFCKRLLPIFPESAEYLQSIPGLAETFLSCTDLRDTVKRAMDTWAINHRKIYFRDVTDQCRNVTAYDRCPAAELFIVPDLPGSDAKTKVGDLAAFVVHNLKDVDFSPVSTAGDSIAPGIGVRESRMVIRAPATQAEFCWYLDTTFCYAFHRSPGVINTLRTLFVIFYIISIAMIVYIIGSAVVAVVAPSTEDADPNAPLECGSRKCTNLIDYLSVMPTVSLCVAVRCPPVKTRTPPHLLAIRSRHSDGWIDLSSSASS
jgi:hypothetical protein